MKSIKKIVRWYFNQYKELYEPMVKYNVPIFM